MSQPCLLAWTCCAFVSLFSSFYISAELVFFLSPEGERGLRGLSASGLRLQPTVSQPGPPPPAQGPLSGHVHACCARLPPPSTAVGRFITWAHKGQCGFSLGVSSWGNAFSLSFSQLFGYEVGINGYRQEHQQKCPSLPRLQQKPSTQESL